MRSTLVSVLSILLAPVLATALSSPASAHGGVWRPPAGGNPGTPAGPGGPATGTPGRPSTGGGFPFTRRGSTGGFDRWELWWSFHRELYLPRHATMQPQQQSDTPGFLTGRGSTHEAGEELALLGSDTRGRLLPVLAAALSDPASQVVDSAAIAIARSTPADEAGPFLPLLERTLGHAERTPREAAIVSLGILGDPSATEKLLEILADSPRGRSLVAETGPIDTFQRGLAALALGLLDQPEAVDPLVAMARSPTAPREVASACVLALGLHQSRAREVVLALRDMLHRRDLDREVRAQIPISMQRLPEHVSRIVLEDLRELVAETKTPNELRRSSAIALGNLARSTDTDVIQTLQNSMLQDSDVMTRNFSCVALGRVGERAGIDPGNPASVENMSEAAFHLVKELRLKKRDGLRPFVALSLGLMMRGENFPALTHESLGSVRQTCGDKVLETFLAESDPSVKGACALALGLMDDRRGLERMREAFRKTSNPTLQGHLVLALALLDDRESIDSFRRLLARQGTDASLRMDVARALGMLQDSDFQDELIALLQDAGSLPEASATAKALGLVGDRRAAEPLLAIVESRSQQDLRRAFAAVALGLLAEKTALPWNLPYAVGANYTLPSRPLSEVLNIL